MPMRLQSSDVKALLLWALITAAMFAVLNLLIVHINVQPPEATAQTVISVATFFVYSLISCSVVALVVGLPLIALTRTGMQTGLFASVVHGAILGLASVAIGMLLIFSESTSSILTVLLLGGLCGACAGVISGRIRATAA